MTNDLKAAAQKLAKEIWERIAQMSHTDIPVVTKMIERKMRAVAKADREEIERYKKALRGIRDSSFDNGCVEVARNALGEE